MKKYTFLLLSLLFSLSSFADFEFIGKKRDSIERVLLTNKKVLQIDYDTLNNQPCIKFRTIDSGDTLIFCCFFEKNICTQVSLLIPFKQEYLDTLIRKLNIESVRLTKNEWIYKDNIVVEVNYDSHFISIDSYGMQYLDKSKH